MKSTYKLLVFIVLAFFFSGIISVQARKPRKLPANSYVTTAKIEILGGQKDKERYKTAIAMLDSLFMYYGYHAEGLYWMTQIYVDYANQEQNLKKKREHISKFAAYRDTLEAACGNKKIKKKYLKKCKKLSEQVDSISVKFWREFYNNGVVQLLLLDTIAIDVSNEEDSITKAYYENRLIAIADSCSDNMFLAMELDPTDYQIYVGLASVNKKMKHPKEATKWLKQALKSGGNRNEVLMELAYIQIEQNDYCGATQYFQEYVDSVTIDQELMGNPDNLKAILNTMSNLAISYNNCKKYDSAYYIFHQILQYDPGNVEVLSGCGRYFRQLAIFIGDTANQYRDTDEAKYKEWIGLRNQQFDSARVYFKLMFENDLKSLEAAESYGLVASVLLKHDEAKIAFERATQIAPDNVDNWISLGDSNLRLQDFKESAMAYEKAVELEPNNKDILESLIALYNELGNKKRMAEIQKMLNSM